MSTGSAAASSIASGPAPAEMPEPNRASRSVGRPASSATTARRAPSRRAVSASLAPFERAVTACTSKRSGSAANHRGGVGPDRSGRAEERDARSRRASPTRPRCRAGGAQQVAAQRRAGDEPGQSRRRRSSPSIRSSTPPWPGMMRPESFTPKRRFNADSRRSPACEAIGERRGENEAGRRCRLRRSARRRCRRRRLPRPGRSPRRTRSSSATRAARVLGRRARGRRNRRRCRSPRRRRGGREWRPSRCGSAWRSTMNAAQGIAT